METILNVMEDQKEVNASSIEEFTQNVADTRDLSSVCVNLHKFFSAQFLKNKYSIKANFKLVIFVRQQYGRDQGIFSLRLIFKHTKLCMFSETANIYSFLKL